MKWIINIVVIFHNDKDIMDIITWTSQVYKLKISTWVDAAHSKDYCICNFNSCQHSNFGLEQKVSKIYLFSFFSIFSITYHLSQLLFTFRQLVKWLWRVAQALNKNIVNSYYISSLIIFNTIWTINRWI